MATLSNVIRGVTENAAGRWVVLVVRVPAAPSRHRVAVWRELRRIGALSLGQSSWAVPDVPAVAEGITRVIELAERGEGGVVVLEATGRGEIDAARLAGLFTAERQAEWAEFLVDTLVFRAINGFARATPWLHTPMLVFTTTVPCCSPRRCWAGGGWLASRPIRG